MRAPVDYTKRRKSTLHRIVACPHCGRKALRRQYNDGSAMYVHRIEYQMPFGAPVVTDQCVTPAPDPEDGLAAALDACDGDIDL